MISAARTYAVVVGIERYEAGSEWKLDGAADSALRIIGWLRECEVPAENITVLLSPLDSNRSNVEQRLADLGFAPEPLPATVEKIRQVVTEQLPEKDGDLLVLFWSGHGVLDRRMERRLFCADAGVHAKYNINVTDLLAALSGKNFKGLRRQVVIVDACANFIHEMRLKLQAPESGFALGDPRPVNRDGLLAAAQGEKAILDRRASLGQVIANWLDEQARTLPPQMDLLAAHVFKRFDQLHADGVTAQHPVRIQEILHGTEHVFGGDPVPENVQQSARSARLTTAQLRATAEAISRTPQLATERGRKALMEALHGVVGPVACTDDPQADLLDLVSAVLDRQAGAALFQALLSLAASEKERIAADTIRHRWELQAAVTPLFGILRRTSLTHVLGALAGTTGDAPEGITGVDQVLELLADLRTSRLAASPLAEFVVRLQHRRRDLEVPAEWFSSQGMDEAAVAALRASIAAEARKPRKLVIDLRDSTSSGWQAVLTGFLGPGWYTRTVTCEPTADGVRRAVAKIVDWARSQAADFAIGFLIRLGMLRELPELWEYGDEVMAPTRLCEEYPVVLHAAERMTIQQLRLAWDSKLAAIEAAAGGVPSVLWLDQDDARVVRHAVQESDAAYVAFSFVPQAGPDVRATAMMAAIAAGAPHVMWVRAAPANGYDLRTQLGEMAGPIKDFPVILRQRRRSDHYLSEALRVIWDSADELPPYLDRLGEELVSNG